MVENFLILRLEEDDHDCWLHYQQDGAPPHFSLLVQDLLVNQFPGRWICMDLDLFNQLHGHIAPQIWPLLTFSSGVSLKIMCLFHLYLLISLSWEIGFTLQLQKWQVTPKVLDRILNEIDFRWVGCLPYHKWCSLQTKWLCDEKLDVFCFKMSPQPIL